MALDVLTFNALMERMTKIHYTDKAEEAWVRVATVNAGMSGKTKGVKKITDAWLGHTSDELAEIARKTGRDGKGFLRDFGLLQGGRV